MKNKVTVIAVLAVIIGIFAFGAYRYKQLEQQKQADTITSGKAQLVRDYSPSMGSPLYKVQLVEFLDPECESCRLFHPIVKQLLEKYKDQIYFVVRYAPFHQNSPEAVAFLEAARIQGKYWETLDTLFRYQPEWADHHHPNPEKKWDYIEELGLDEAKMREDMKLPKIQEIIETDVKDGKALGVRGTPTFFVNGQPLERFGPEYLDQAIQQALQ